MYGPPEFLLVKAFLDSHLEDLRKDAALHRIIKEAYPSTRQRWSRLKWFTAKVTSYVKSFTFNISDLGTRLN